MKRVIITIIFFLLLILVWAALTGDLAAFGLDISLWSPYVLPPPSTVGHYLWDNNTFPSSRKRANLFHVFQNVQTPCATRQFYG